MARRDFEELRAGDRVFCDGMRDVRGTVTPVIDDAGRFSIYSYREPGYVWVKLDDEDVQRRKGVVSFFNGNLQRLDAVEVLSELDFDHPSNSARRPC
jgi:hypothetical protein